METKDITGTAKGCKRKDIEITDEHGDKVMKKMYRVKVISKTHGTFFVKSEEFITTGTIVDVDDIREISKKDPKTGDRIPHEDGYTYYRRTGVDPYFSSQADYRTVKSGLDLIDEIDFDTDDTDQDDVVQQPEPARAGGRLRTTR